MDPVSRTYTLAFLVTSVFGFGDHLYTLTRVASWEHANRTCTLATPKIHYSRQGLTLDFGDDLKGVVGEHWVGYTTHNYIFQYIGCSLDTVVGGVLINIFTLPSSRPGFCYSACDTDVFGMKDKQCYCIETLPNVDVDKQSCTWPCAPAGIKCGGESTVSIFKVADLTMHSFTRAPSDTDYCIAYDLPNQAFIWEDCNRPSRAQWCQTSSGHTPTTSDKSKTWSTAAEHCFYANDITTDVDNSDPYWTGYFRTYDVIRTFKDRETPVLYGHVNISGKTEKPKIWFDDTKNDFDAICVEMPVSTILTTTLECSTITPGMPVSTMFSDTAIESTVSTQNHEKKYLPIKIGVPLLIFACVAVVVAGVICYRRRRTTSMPSGQAPNIVEQYSQVQDPYDDAQNVYNEPFDKTIEKQTNTSKHDHDHRSMPNNESEYDTTCVVGKSAAERSVGYNFYNTLELVTDDSYDHVNGPNNKRDTRADKPGSRNAKVGYGVVAQNTYDRVDIEQGSYSHVNVGIRKQETTDNVYN